VASRREFVVLCRRLKLFSEAMVAIDGSKFKAVNNRDKNFTDAKLKKRMEQLEESIARYLAELDRADREPTVVPEGKVCRLKDKIAAVKEQMQRLNQIAEQLRKAPDQQLPNRSGCTLHGHQRQRQRNGRIQRARVRWIPSTI
jgi:prefoldin subunit 5